MNTIFLSASIPTKGREFFDSANPLVIRDAIVAFTRVCLEYNIRFFFGGHPAITPLVYQIASNFKGGNVEVPISVYQSEWFRELAPKEVDYFKNIVWTPKQDTLEDSVALMRNSMFEDNKQFCCAVFIGGMKGILDEAERIQANYPKVRLLPIAGTGAASKVLYNKLHLDNEILKQDVDFISVFRKILLEYKD